MLSSRTGAWLTRGVGCLLVLVVILLCVEVATDLLAGVTTTTNKWGPRHTYTVGSQPFKYWTTVASQAVLIVVLGPLAAGCFWLAKLEARPDTPPHPRKHKRK